MSRRTLLAGATAPGCPAPLWPTHAAALKPARPRMGGILRLGLGGGSTTDSLDPLSWTDSVMIAVSFSLYNCLVENGADNRPIPELAESYDARPGAAEWIFSLRRGITFSNGKEFDADDAIYSLNRHRGRATSGAAGPMTAITDIGRLDRFRIVIRLAGGDADFPTVLSDYHVVMVPNDYRDWSRPVGTGAFELERFDPGRQIVLTRRRPYWKPDRGYLDGVDLRVISDTFQRMSALISGEVDAINRADPRTVSRIGRSPTLEVVRAAGGWFPLMAMQVDREPYGSAHLRQALRLALDREQMIKTLFSGYGSLGNDHPIPRSDPYFNTELPQTVCDPDKARASFRAAGLVNPKIVLRTSDAAFNGAADMARLFQANAARADIPIDVVTDPADGYFDRVWLTQPFVTSYWGGRPSATQMLSVAYKSGAHWNETHWANAAFDQMLALAQAETDDDKRKRLVFDMQEMLAQQGGSLIPCFRDWLDAHHHTVGGHTPHSGFDMCNGRIAEKAYLIE